MYECNVVELNDSRFNHLVQNYDFEIMEMIEYSQEHGSMVVHAEYDGEVYWDEH